VEPPHVVLTNWSSLDSQQQPTTELCCSCCWWLLWWQITWLPTS